MKRMDWFVYVLVLIFLFQFLLETIVPGWPQLWPWVLITAALVVWLTMDQYPEFFSSRRYPMFNTSMMMFVIAIAVFCASMLFNGRDSVIAAWIGVGFVGVGGIFLLFYFLSTPRHRPVPPWGVVRSRFAREDLDRPK